jgi:hypothetical protein
MRRILTDELQLRTLKNRIIAIRTNPGDPQQSLLIRQSGAALTQEATPPRQVQLFLRMKLPRFGGHLPYLEGDSRWR